eukprot:Lankesteria_metandrocarpae@DN4954_c0_g1_i11.p1
MDDLTSTDNSCGSGPGPVRNSSSFWNLLKPLSTKFADGLNSEICGLIGMPNCKGRPGPVLNIALDRPVQRTQRRQRSPSRQTYLGPTTGDTPGLIVLTPRAADWYQLDGQNTNSTVFPEPANAFCFARVAGVGRVFVFSSQRGRVFIVKVDEPSSMIIVDIHCQSAAQIVERASSSRLNASVSRTTIAVGEYIRRRTQSYYPVSSTTASSACNTADTNSSTTGTNSSTTGTNSSTTG